MASKEYYLRGTINWAKTKTPDTKYGEFYTVDLVLDEASYGLFKDSGAQLKERQSEDGIMIKLRRPVSKKIRGEEVIIGPPKVLLKGEDGEYKPFDGLIGNGSTGVCKIRVYDTQKGKGHELETIGIESLVAFEGGESVGGEDLPF